LDDEDVDREASQMRARWGVLLLSLGVACSELKSASLPHAGTSADGGTAVLAPDGAPLATDGGQLADGPPPVLPPVCDGPCTVQTIATAHGTGALAVDDRNVYFTTDATLYQCPKSGCGDFPIPLAPGTPSTIAIARGGVFWGDSSGLKRCPIGGCDGVAATISEGPVRDIVNESDSLFWIERGATSDLVRTCPAGDCRLATIATVTDTTTQTTTGFGVGASTLIWPTKDAVTICGLLFSPNCTEKQQYAGDGYPIVADGKAVWRNGTEIDSCLLGDRGCSEAVKPVTSSRQPSHLTGDDSAVYWRDALDDRIYRCPFSGCTVPDTIATSIGTAVDAGLAVDDDYIYWSDAKGIERRLK
jgi:hypothetical protein